MLNEIFIDRILEHGFIVDQYNHQYNKKAGWLGVTTYHPDAFFTKVNSNNRMLISLQGIGMSSCLSNKEFNDAIQRHEVLFDAVCIKYLCMIIDDKKVFETFTGETPPHEIVDEFLK